MAVAAWWTHGMTWKCNHCHVSNCNEFRWNICYAYRAANSTLARVGILYFLATVMVNKDENKGWKNRLADRQTDRLTQKLKLSGIATRTDWQLYASPVNNRRGHKDSTLHSVRFVRATKCVLLCNTYYMHTVHSPRVAIVYALLNRSWSRNRSGCDIGRGRWKCGSGKCRSGKFRSRQQGWKMQEWKMQE